jgi:glycosyltransferase involved in cell wall biosynthesis
MSVVFAEGAERLGKVAIPVRQRPRVMFLVASDYSSLEKKGVAPLILERDENGYFERVVTVHPIAQSSRRIDLNAVHRIEEMHLARPAWLPRAFLWLLAPFYLLGVLFRVHKLLREERIDIVRATDPAFMGLIGWIVTRMPRRPFCVSLHADYDKRFALDGALGAPTIAGSRFAARLLERFIYRHADLIMPIRETLARKIEMEGGPPTRIRVIPHGIDLTLFTEKATIDIREELKIPASRQIISFAGRIERENYSSDVLALAQKLASRSDCVVVIAGGGSEEATIRAAVGSNSALADIVVMPGFLTRDRVAALRQQSAVSLCLMGGFSLIEACAAGSPVLSYDVEWHGELVKDGITGFLIPEHDVDKLAERTILLLDSPSMVGQLGAAARALACQRHDLAKTSLIKRACYDTLLATEAHST